MTALIIVSIVVCGIAFLGQVIVVIGTVQRDVRKLGAVALLALALAIVTFSLALAVGV